MRVSESFHFCTLAGGGRGELKRNGKCGGGGAYLNHEGTIGTI